jgi:2-oxoglutarate dehydrogenase E1 component
MNGIVLLLPHGYEGQGPEHSNAYLERFLSLCAEDNMQVCVPTTPAQYFHMLRRQMHRKFRKPLVLMMPKSLLRYEPGSSRLQEFTDASARLVIDDPNAVNPARVRRLLLCTGKIYYTLLAARQKAGLVDQGDDVAVVRIEQLYPFPARELQAAVHRYRGVQEVAWVQEEPKNRGAWSFMSARLAEMFPDTVVQYVGRDESSSPASGSFKLHQVEEQEIIAHALGLHATAGTGQPAASVAAVTAPGTPATASSPTPVSK